MCVCAVCVCVCVVCVCVSGDKYMVADCGGGTVDLTVHQIEQPQGTLKELYKASGTTSALKLQHTPRKRSLFHDL